MRPRLRLSSLPPFDAAQRWVSYLVWGAWLLNFLFWELTGTLRFTPWRTLSETGWDVEAKHPDAQRLLQGFLLGLAVHIRYRTTLESSFRLGMALQDTFDDSLKGVMPSDRSSGSPVTRPLAGGQDDGGGPRPVGQP